VQRAEEIDLGAAHDHEPQAKIQRSAGEKGHEKMHASDDPEYFLAEGEGRGRKIRRADDGERPFDHPKDAGNFLI
jgi:hypothetical protein